MVPRRPPAVPPLLPPFLAGWCHGKREYSLCVVLDRGGACQCQVKAGNPSELSLAAVMWPLWPKETYMVGVAVKPLGGRCGDPSQTAAASSLAPLSTRPLLSLCPSTQRSCPLCCGLRQDKRFLTVLVKHLGLSSDRPSKRHLLQYRQTSNNKPNFSSLLVLLNLPQNLLKRHL